MLVLKMIVILIGWFLCFQSFLIVKDITEIKGFVPHEILGVDLGAEISVIKKAYRKLAREKHPDKNPDNPAAVGDFMQITKAYTILTDPVARENFAKFGNPDGRGMFDVSIALPAFLSDKDYQLHVLITFFVVVIFVIPGYFLFVLNQEEKD